eukprot:Hpha_TRINITY_DN15526_c1_g1::TRINITY_DN15526_c1_g1_i1::g.104190::m.104190/K01465/URA4, pyrC; dihydroorotase
MVESRVMVRLVVTGGCVYDASQGLCDAALDVIVQDGVIEALLPPGEGAARHPDAEVYDAGGGIVCAGLIDAHVHVYEHSTPLGVNPDQHCLQRGVTTVVDAGSAGATTYPGLLRYVAERSVTRVLALLNVSKIGLASAGMAGKAPCGENDSLNELDVEAVVAAAAAAPDTVVGVKVRLQRSVCDEGRTEAEAYARAQAAAAELGLPLMTHHIQSGVAMEACPLRMRAGDIYTHSFHGWEGGAIVELVPGDDGEPMLRVRESVRAAREHGVLFDVGHGGGAFSWPVAEAAIVAGFLPDLVSTDLHSHSCGPRGPAYDLPTVASKMLHCGMPLPAVIEAMTTAPAKAFKQYPRLGTLRPGSVGDITVLSLHLPATPVPIEDSHGQVRHVAKVLRAQAVFAKGVRHEVSEAVLGAGGGNKGDLQHAALLYKDGGSGGCCGGSAAHEEPRREDPRLLGVPPVINAVGTMTSLGGSVMATAARDAAAAASAHYLDINALLGAAGRRIAELSKAPEGYTALPCTGAAAGLALSTAACAQLAFPDLAPGDFPLCREGEGARRCAVAVDASADLRWVNNIALCGLEVLQLGTKDAPMTSPTLEAALRPPGTGHSPTVVAVMVTAAELGIAGRLGLCDVVKVADAARVPVVVDAAAMLGGASGAEPLWSYTHAGAGAVLFSGGKLLRGSQSSGFIIGKAELIAKAKTHASPNEGSIGRLAKTTKEDICALAAAVEAFVGTDFPAALERLRGMCTSGAAWLERQGIPARVEYPDPVSETDVQPNTIPRLVIPLAPPPGGAGEGAAPPMLDHSNPLALPQVSPTIDPCGALRAALAHLTPPIALGVTPRNEPSISPLCLSDGDMGEVLRAVHRWHVGVYGPGGEGEARP